MDTGRAVRANLYVSDHSSRTAAMTKKFKDHIGPSRVTLVYGPVRLGCSCDWWDVVLGSAGRLCKFKTQLLYFSADKKETVAVVAVADRRADDEVLLGDILRAINGKIYGSI